MDKSLVFFDLDGTLLHGGFGKNALSAENTKALLRLKEAGHEIFINSGRSPSLMPKDLLNEVDFDGFVCGSTYIEYHGEVLHRVIPDDDLIRRICYYTHNAGWRVGLECEKEVYGINGGIFHPAINMSPRLDEFMKEPSKLLVTKFTFDRDVTDEVKRMFPEIYFINFGGFSEGIIAGYNKAFGMKFLEERLGIEHKNIVAFGDSVNDIEMLRYAGISVLMHSGPKEFDEFITFRTDTDRNGVCEGINKIFFS